MTVELKDYSEIGLNSEKKSKMMLFACDESAITCQNLSSLRDLIVKSGKEVILVMPDWEYKKGKRGWAKAHILSSVSQRIVGVLALDSDEVRYEMEIGSWGEVMINGALLWDNDRSLGLVREGTCNLKISETSDPFDLEMIERMKKIIEGSNCWLDPAGALIIKDGKILAEGVSTSFNGSNCKAMPFSMRELSLEEGQRMFFCDSLHAERVAISYAAKKGIGLEGATIYVSKYPCRHCLQTVIAAGIENIVFEEDSYGLIETVDLVEENNIRLKKVVRS